MIESLLENTGLTHKESKAYVAALELGETTIERLAKKSGIKRTTLYDVVDNLKGRGLISTLRRKKRTYYYAEDPRAISGQLKEKQETFESILPELLSIANFIEKKPRIRYFEGLEGLKEVYKETLKFPNQEMLAWISEEAFTNFDEPWIRKHYIPKRIAQKIWVRAIVPDTSVMRTFKAADGASLRQTRLVSGEKFPFAIELSLYGKNHIAIMAFEEKIGMLIESQKIYTTLRSIFEMNWLWVEKNDA